MADVYQIASGPDDAHESQTAGVVHNGGSLKLEPFDTALTGIGMRFTGVTKPVGGTLIGATLYLTGTSATGGTWTGTIYGESSAASVDFSTDPDVVGRSRTSGITWNDTVVGGAEVDSPDLTSIINAIMALTGWESGDPVTLLLIGSADGGAYGADLDFESKDGAVNKEPRLELEWSVPVTVEHPPRAAVIQSPTAIAGLGHDVAPVPVQAIASATPQTLTVDQAIASPASGVAMGAAAGAFSGGAVESDSPAAAFVAIVPAVAGLGWTVDVQPVSIVGSGPPAVVSPGITVEPTPADVVAGSPPATWAMATIAQPDPLAVTIGSGRAEVTGGIAVAATAAAVTIATPSAVVSPGIRSAAVPAAGVLGTPPGTWSIETIGRQNPLAVTIGRGRSAVTGGIAVAATAAAVTIATPPAVVSPGIRAVALPAAGVLGTPQGTWSIETIGRPNPLAVMIGRGRSAVTGGIAVAATAAAVTIATPAAVVSPGIRAVAVPAAGVLGTPQGTWSIETIGRPAAVAAVAARNPHTVSSGATVSITPSAASVACAPPIVRPGTMLVHDPAASAGGVIGAVVAVETIAKPAPRGVLVAGQRHRPGLGHIIAPTAAAVVVSPIVPRGSGGATVSSPAVGVTVSAAAAPRVGVTVQPIPAGLTAAAAASAITIAGEITAPPAPLVGGTIRTVTVGGVVVSQVPGAAAVDVLPSRMGALHLFGPDLFFTLGNARLHYTLPASRLHYTMGASMSTAKQIRSKAAGETKDLAFDCATALKDVEKITSINSVTVSDPDDLTITGIAVNDSVLSEPGFPDAQIGQAVQCFVGGGTPGTLYTLTFNYTTDGGQTLEARAKLQVT